MDKIVLFSACAYALLLAGCAYVPTDSEKAAAVEACKNTYSRLAGTSGKYAVYDNFWDGWFCYSENGTLLTRIDSEFIREKAKEDG